MLAKSTICLEINMDMNRSTLAAALMAALAVGASGHAAASVYARSYLDISSLHILPVTAVGSTTVNLTGVSIGTYTFDGQNTASLNNGPTAADTKSCTGTYGGVSNCGPSGNRLNPLVVNAAGSTVLQGENAFTFNGPGSGQYANADGLIRTAAVAGDASTHTTNIAESELQTGTAAASASVIDSITKFTFSFSTTAAGTLMVSFHAIQDMLAAINDPTGLTHQALGSMNTVLQLSTDSGAAGFLNYTPDGSTSTGCIAAGIFTCTEYSDPFSLNTNVGTSTNGTSDAKANTGDFLTYIGIGGAGNYTLTLSEKKSTLLSRTVPEPGALALLGIGLLGLGVSTRRKNRA